MILTTMHKLRPINWHNASLVQIYCAQLLFGLPVVTIMTMIMMMTNDKIISKYVSCPGFRQQRAVQFYAQALAWAGANWRTLLSEFVARRKCWQGGFRQCTADQHYIGFVVQNSTVTMAILLKTPWLDRGVGAVRCICGKLGQGRHPSQQ